jgi:transcriptional regulator with XRE-family HTH domain/quercetin dioxygenase-like cupin family protein
VLLNSAFVADPGGWSVEEEVAMAEATGDAGVTAIGARIRAERERRGMSVRGLARDVGVSPSLISQIETSKTLPSVSTLYAITTALGVPVDEIFDPAPAVDGVAVAAPISSDLARAAGAPPRKRDHKAGPHLCPADREQLTLDSGVVWERLGQLPGQHVEFLRITYQPGSTSSSSGDLMRHPGTEYGYLVSGALGLLLGFDEYHMAAGDSVCFDSTTPHGYRNDGKEPAIGVWFVVEDS